LRALPAVSQERSFLLFHAAEYGAHLLHDCSARYKCGPLVPRLQLQVLLEGGDSRSDEAAQPTHVLLLLGIVSSQVG
jgi:hypothetical protein